DPRLWRRGQRMIRHGPGSWQLNVGKDYAGTGGGAQRLHGRSKAGDALAWYGLTRQTQSMDMITGHTRILHSYVADEATRDGGLGEVRMPSDNNLAVAGGGV